MSAGAVTPYFCQWETVGLAQDIIMGDASPADDPLWAASGALTQEEYIAWANHVCGMACFKMVWAALSGRTFPTMELARAASHYGAYTVDAEGIHGMIYAPFVTFVREEFDLEARVETGLAVQDLPALTKQGKFFMASVHSSIRWPETTPPRKGGHLVLVTACDERHITFHNPSGHTRETQQNVTLPLDVFDRFFAGRGVLIVGDVVA